MKETEKKKRFENDEIFLNVRDMILYLRKSFLQFTW